MYGREALVDELTWEECWTHLRHERLGRLALGHGPSLELFPINYVADGQTIYLPTSVGTKSAMIAASPWVAFEIDGTDDGWTWSVVVKGPTRRVHSLADLDVLGQLVVPSESPGMKELYLRMDAVDVTGRRFRSAL